MGKITKSDQRQLAKADPEYQQYLDSIPPERRASIDRHAGSLRTGLQAMAPLQCAGPHKCLFIAHCPIPTKDKAGKVDYGTLDLYPMYRSCVMEHLYLVSKINEYAAYLGVDQDNPVEVAIVNDLAIIDLYKNRALMVMSAGDRDGAGADFMKTDITNFADDGTPMTSTAVHPAFDIVEKLEKRRDRLLDKLIETRKGRMDAQAKLGVGQEQNRVLEELQQVKELLLTHSEKVQELPAYDDEEIKID